MAQFYGEGAYIGKVNAQGFGESKEKKTPFFFLNVQVEAYEDGSPVEKSYERTVECYLTDKTLEMFTEILKALGYEWRNGFGDIDPSNPQHHNFVGQEVALWCKHDGDYEKWQISRPPGGKQIEQLDSVAVRKLDNLFGKAMKGGSTTSAPRPAAARQAAPAFQADSSDVPF